MGLTTAWHTLTRNSWTRLCSGSTQGLTCEAPGTDISAELFAGILRAVTSENVSLPIFGVVNFNRAHFLGDASFIGVRFSGRAVFRGRPVQRERPVRRRPVQRGTPGSAARV